MGIIDGIAHKPLCFKSDLLYFVHVMSFRVQVLQSRFDCCFDCSILNFFISFPFQGAGLIAADLYRVKKVCVMALCLSVCFLVK
jgi:hypothetical protein